VIDEIEQQLASRNNNQQLLLCSTSKRRSSGAIEEASGGEESYQILVKKLEEQLEQVRRSELNYHDQFRWNHVKILPCTMIRFGFLRKHEEILEAMLFMQLFWLLIESDRSFEVQLEWSTKRLNPCKLHTGSKAAAGSGDKAPGG
jgi:hypothetical protein